MSRFDANGPRGPWRRGDGRNGGGDGREGGGARIYRFTPRGEPPRPKREPAFNAPWAAVALAAAMPILYGLQSLGPWSEGVVYSRLGLIPALAMSGAWWTLLTHQFLHGFWMHAILNAVALLAFGTPVARFLGERGAAGPARYFGFFLVTGVLAGLGYLLLHPGSTAVLVGASGGAAGLMGAASRMFAHPGRLAPFRDRMVLGLAAGWIVINVAFAVLGGFAPGSGGVPVAWEAHIAGYAAGLFLIGPFARLTRAR